MVRNVEICLLGSLEVFDDAGLPLAITGPRVATLLTLLALRCGEVVSDDALVDALWGAAPPDQSANALQRQISRLRNAFGSPDVIVRRPGGYALSADQSMVDVFRFDALAARGHEAMQHEEPSRARDLFDEALRLWRGDPLAHVAYEEFAQPEIARLTEARLAATEARIDADLALGRDAALIGELEQLVAAHPLREHVRAQLMLALSRSGRQAEALRVYQDTRVVLGDELGIEPSAELRSLETAILRQESSVSVRQDVEMPRARPKTNLRTPLTALIGRARDMDALRPILHAHRLVTLVGPGGVGKSRLAHEAARELFAAGDDEVWMVELAEVTDGNQLVPEIMTALDLPRAGSERADLPRLIEYLHARRALVVLDNCEHLLAAAARVAQDLLESCASLRILGTSREGLAVPGEVLWAVPPLALEHAVALFVERGRAADPTSDITDDSQRTKDTVADVCARLDGLPLAIELAAARLRAMPIAELAAGLEDRFRLLTRGARTAVPRQQTMRAVVDWSYDLLFDDERLVFDRLSVFRGSCSLAAARVVCADDEISGDDVSELITRLVDKSLVVIETDEFDGYARCHMLQTLVDYGRDRLEDSGDAARVYAAHLGYYSDFAVRSIAALRGHRQRGWLRAVAANLTNLRAALEVAVGDGDADTAYNIAGSLGWYWWWTGRGLEASEWLALARSCQGEVGELARARVLAWMVFADAPGLVRWGEAGGARQSREPSIDGCLSLDEIGALCREAVALYSRAGVAKEELAGVEIALSVTFSTLGEFTYASELLVDAERLLAAAGADPAAEGMRAFAIGRRCFVEDRYPEAERAFRESIERFSASAIDVHLVLALRLAARLAAVRGDHTAAVDDLERGCVIARTLAISGAYNLLLDDLGESLSASGETERARAVLAQTLASAREVGFLRGISEALTGLAITEWRAGEPERAARCAEECLDSARRIDYFEAVAYCLVVLGWSAGRRGDLREARSRQLDALEVARGADMPRATAFALEGLADLALREGDGSAAARFLGASQLLRRAPGAAVGSAVAAGARFDEGHLLEAAGRLAGDRAIADAFAKGAADPEAVISMLTREQA
jgi:predicted ATPase/DNA-binding SARP family transcriptional activator